MNNKLVGLSLSQCVADIINGSVNYDDVERISSRTRIENEYDLNHVIQKYRECFWSANPDRGEEITRQLVAENKLDQPRLYDMPTVTTCYGRWIIVGTPDYLDYLPSNN